jgi:hypothetical protein
LHKSQHIKNQQEKKKKL